MLEINISDLITRLSENKIEITELQADQIIRYYELVCERNREMNLTAITEWNEFLNKHILDSLSLSMFVKDMTDVSYSLIDVGTGAGFPGIPLKIVFPSLKVTLLDSLRKRTDFLNEVIIELGLKEITAVHGRAEDFGKDPAYREQYDFAVSRAVAKMTVLSEICIPFIKKDGLFAAYKTEESSDEVMQAVSAIELLGGSSEQMETVSYSIEGFDKKRMLFLIRKIKETPERYPRKSGQIEKKPL